MEPIEHRATATEEKVRGCCLGAAVGDALAFPYAGLSPVFTRSLARESVDAFRPHRSGKYTPGQSSFRGRMLVETAEAVAAGGEPGRAERIGTYLYPLARDRLLVEAPPGLIGALESWARGRPAPASPRGEAPVHLLPLALVGGRSSELAAAARCTGHGAPELLALGAAFLAAVDYSLHREEIVLGEFLDTVRIAASSFSEEVAGELGSIPDLLCRSERDGVNAVAVSDSAFAVIAGLISFLKSPYDCRRSFLIAQRSGGGCAAAFVCGALCGAFGGEAKIPGKLRDTLAIRAELEASVAALLSASAAHEQGQGEEP